MGKFAVACDAECHPEHSEGSKDFSHSEKLKNNVPLLARGFLLKNSIEMR
jgi:hypothetical protein